MPCCALMRLPLESGCIVGLCSTGRAVPRVFVRLVGDRRLGTNHGAGIQSSKPLLTGPLRPGSALLTLGAVMSLWLTYGLLGVVAGPVVVTASKRVVLHEPLRWGLVSRSEWTAAFAASGLLATSLVKAAERHPMTVGAVSWLAIMGLMLSLIDWASYRLPKVLVGALLAGGSVQFGVAALVLSDGAGRLLRAVVALVSVFAFSMTMALVSPDSWGAGDVTLSATVAFFLGWFSWWHVISGLFLAFAVGAITFGALYAVGAHRRGMVIPLGPALIFASVCVIQLL
jgi:leader peptidase (prepilin peptidase) / N-methyltransferase